MKLYFSLIFKEGYWEEFWEEVRTYVFHIHISRFLNFPQFFIGEGGGLLGLGNVVGGLPVVGGYCVTDKFNVSPNTKIRTTIPALCRITPSK